MATEGRLPNSDLAKNIICCNKLCVYDRAFIGELTVRGGFDVGGNGRIGGDLTVVGSVMVGENVLIGGFLSVGEIMNMGNPINITETIIVDGDILPAQGGETGMWSLGGPGDCWLNLYVNNILSCDPFKPLRLQAGNTANGNVVSVGSNLIPDGGSTGTLTLGGPTSCWLGTYSNNLTSCDPGAPLTLTSATGEIVLDGDVDISGAVEVGGNILPDMDNAYTLGDPTHCWMGTFSNNLDSCDLGTPLTITSATGVVDVMSGMNVSGGITADGNIIPLTTDTYTLGNTAQCWRGGFMNNVSSCDGSLTLKSFSGVIMAMDTVEVTGDVYPNVNGTHTLGTAGRCWQNTFTNNLTGCDGSLIITSNGGPNVVVDDNLVVNGNVLPDGNNSRDLGTNTLCYRVAYANNLIGCDSTSNLIIRSDGVGRIVEIQDNVELRGDMYPDNNDSRDLGTNTLCFRVAYANNLIGCGPNNLQVRSGTSIMELQDNVEVDGNLYPKTNGTQFLGSGATCWANTYTNIVTACAGNNLRLLAPPANAISVTNDILPETDASHNLGAPTFCWDNVYAQTYHSCAGEYMELKPNGVVPGQTLSGIPFHDIVVFGNIIPAGPYDSNGKSAYDIGRFTEGDETNTFGFSNVITENVRSADGNLRLKAKGDNNNFIIVQDCDAFHPNPDANLIGMGETGIYLGRDDAKWANLFFDPSTLNANWSSSPNDLIAALNNIADALNALGQNP